MRAFSSKAVLPTGDGAVGAPGSTVVNASPLVAPQTPHPPDPSPLVLDGLVTTVAATASGAGVADTPVDEGATPSGTANKQRRDRTASTGSVGAGMRRTKSITSTVSSAVRRRFVNQPAGSSKATRVRRPSLVLHDITIPRDRRQGGVVTIGSTIRDGLNPASADDAARLAMEGNYESDVVQLQFKEPANLYEMVKHTALATTLEALKGIRLQARAEDAANAKPMVSRVRC
jgi:hypothetical protein